MELATEPDIYSPNIDNNGNYIDKVPSFNTNVLANGIRCPCGTRKDKIYTSTSIFSSHIKTKTHEKWLQDLNTNKANFYIENQKLKDVVQSQKIMIGKMDIEILNKIMTIDYLTQQLTKTSKKLKKETEEKITANDMIMFNI